MATAGRTVTFSALIVAISIAGLLVFQPPILRAFGAAGVAVIVVAVATALTLVPALLVLAGRRMIRPSILARIPGLRGILARTADVQTEEGRLLPPRRPGAAPPVDRAARRALAVLGILALPLAHLELRNSTTELLPAGSAQREFVDTLARDYPAASTPAITVVAQTSLDEATAWAATLEDLDGVASVDPPSPVDSYVVIGVRPDTDDPGDAVARDVVHQIRALDAPFPTWVTGQAASQIDFTAAVVERAPWAIGIVAVATPRAAVPHDRLGRRAGQGAAHQRDLAGGVAGRARLGVPGRPPVRPAELHADRRHRDLRHRPRDRLRVRAGDGLRGVPAVPDQGARRPGRARTTAPSGSACSGPAGSSPRRR